MGYEFRTCMHGVTEGLDSHECTKCQLMAAEYGFRPMEYGYFFARPLTEKQLQKLKHQWGER